MVLCDLGEGDGLVSCVWVRENPHEPFFCGVELRKVRPRKRLRKSCEQNLAGVSKPGLVRAKTKTRCYASGWNIWSISNQKDVKLGPHSHSVAKYQSEGTNWSQHPKNGLLHRAEEDHVRERNFALSEYVLTHIRIISPAISLPSLRCAVVDRAPTILQNDWFYT